MSRDEQRVRAAWVDVTLQWGTVERKRYVMVSASGRAIPLHGYETEAEAYSAAAAYTDDVIEEARQMQREIEIVERIVLWYGNEAARSIAMGLPCAAGGEARDEIAAKRAITRLQALYDMHVRGLKSEALR